MRLFKHLCLKVNHDGVVQSCTQTKAGFITGTRYFEQNDIFFFNTYIYKYDAAAASTLIIVVICVLFFTFILSKEYLKLFNRLYDISLFGSVYA